jgi:hypothetical protein
MTPFLKFLRGVACSLVFGLCMSADTRAELVDVTYTVSGSANDWTYDFTVTNNLGGSLDIYAFRPGLPSYMPTGSPTLWVPNFTYNQWCYVNCTAPLSDLGPGQTLGGFALKDTSPSSFSSVPFLIAAIDCDRSNFGFFCGAVYSNPVFTGVAILAAPVSNVPLPAALPLLIGGLASLGLVKRGGQRKTAA